MSRTLAELASLHLEIDAEAAVLWKRDWQPRFDTTRNTTQFDNLVEELNNAAGVTRTDHLPGLYSVYLVFAMDALRQRTKASGVTSEYNDDDFKPGY